ncbi:Peroxisome biogenesis protein 16 [Porphyridium purpureum]|uniref:Peroxisomal membrane protein PEX16 n=1 Tax=Porphyridium purpureum TaxID=35688 RepID=A0A5J4YNR0_PORPP|nr:Peroxisome biogenesis protein 16 [Porphyridium purpureum]KAA8492350.1 Peroxisome biogenesis protein 16 [Porphyridium purpureum]|eukprot:POR6851..scf249_10
MRRGLFSVELKWEAPLGMAQQSPQTRGGMSGCMPRLKELIGDLRYADYSFRKWMLQNAQLMSLLEDVTRALAVVMPGKLSELTAESCHFLMALLHLYRDAPVIHKQRHAFPLHAVVLGALHILKSAQLLIEMLTRRIYRKQDRNRILIVLVIVELLKLILRSSLLFGLRRWPFRAQQLLTVSDESFEPDSGSSAPAASRSGLCRCRIHSSHIRTGRLSGKRFLTLEAAGLKDGFAEVGSNSQGEYQGRNQPEDTNASSSPCNECLGHMHDDGFGGRNHEVVVSDRSLPWNGLIGELCHVSRPSVELLLMMKFGPMSWIPWLVALGIDVSGISLVPSESDADRAEKLRRKLALVYFLARNPVYSRVIRRHVLGRLTKLPLAGGLISGGVEVLDAIQAYWFYVSAS